jgi:hypothetical protein
MTGRFLTAAMIVFALVVVPLAAYVGGYYGLQEHTLSDPTWRIYPHRWQSEIFKPAGRVEQWLTDSDVTVCCTSDLHVIE